MGVKKTISLSLLLLANLFLLAHAAIPHHHHNQIPVALNSADHGDNDEECFIQAGFTAVEKRQHSEACHCCPPPVAVLADFHHSAPEIHASPGEDLQPKPPVSTYHYDYLTRSLGLRAPPVC